MDKTIGSLIPDIENVLVNGVEITDEQVEKFGKIMAEMLRRRLAPRTPREGTLRMSNIGKPDRQLWYEVNTPQDAEPMHPNAYMKFLIGDITEEVVLLLAELAGHKVEGQQDEQEIEGIKGHRDVVIDGTTVDVKSASPYSFKKFSDGLKPEDDSFGYIMQINSYIEAGQDDPIVTNKDGGAFLVLQKVTGDLTLDYHSKTNIPIRKIYEHKKEVVSRDEVPERCYPDVPEGKSGNMKLDIVCSYCPFKRKCWPELRTFIYANGPVFLTKVVREPNVPEAK